MQTKNKQQDRLQLIFESLKTQTIENEEESNDLD